MCTYSHLVALSILLNHNYISKSFQICYIKKLIKRTGKRVDKWTLRKKRGLKTFQQKRWKRWLFCVVCFVILHSTFLQFYRRLYFVKEHTFLCCYEWYFINIYKKWMYPTETLIWPLSFLYVWLVCSSIIRYITINITKLYQSTSFSNDFIINSLKS